MQIYPAIDLKEGCAVRLSKGEMSSAKIYSREPAELAKVFADFGAQWLHVVDLDGAFAAELVNFKTIEKIIKATNLKVQIGGGIRDEERIKRYLDIGASRVILGSIALKNPSFVKEVAPKYPVVVGIDARGGMVATEGWAQTSNVRADVLAKEFNTSGVRAIITTDIEKDGMLKGVNTELVRQVALSSGLETIASGGVSSLDDIRTLAELEYVGGVIVGKAYYEAGLDLRQAFRIAGA
ncbi:1-(5-phosphoribosyl)-5-[(5-phosphoribosylamino)methylideneamino]imidazole-4-carboxamide isomerase [Campylobacter sp. 19-13652]|uniref:1-(5-phosphoribosyl)-5-[(5- phosphoribosylamino)methylideneamino]imidazole-4- carboxamide isomerase n=1 Tax=Campylobacter sp. 19-13652 TaxID=2840180 RepID=UPI001C796656|nr:1-(5-phosphoribosyl)-5-[(5-phosphoribosylamino)methylideneamino]imidazole-4-carboxamide isomerase [Campylobacter sp. 19-13652]BCX79946.1 1-(5-phosphoribosyl)-5-[(5-phosphoribosylamino) methylideneamino] imidazole-4-carboxamide isomerase [Campylobacter sp. 19-13652]